MELEEIKTTVDLLKKSNCKRFVTLVELAKELRHSKTKVMQFLSEHERYFVLAERWEPKEKTITRQMFGRKYKDTIQIRGKHLGLCIENAYTSLDQNHHNIEWVNRMKFEKAKYIELSVANNYGYIMGYFVQIDKENKEDEYRKHLWRNTPEKIAEIKPYLKSGGFIYGGFGDSYTNMHDNIITIDSINELKGKGYTFSDFPPLSR